MVNKEEFLKAINHILSSINPIYGHLKWRSSGWTERRGGQLIYPDMRSVQEFSLDEVSAAAEKLCELFQISKKSIHAYGSRISGAAFFIQDVDVLLTNATVEQCVRKILPVNAESKENNKSDDSLSLNVSNITLGFISKDQKPPINVLKEEIVQKKLSN